MRARSKVRTVERNMSFIIFCNYKEKDDLESVEKDFHFKNVAIQCSSFLKPLRPNGMSL